MTDEEARKKLLELKEKAFDTCSLFIRMDATTVRHCGHLSVGDALVHTMTRAVKSVEKVIMEHLGEDK